MSVGWQSISSSKLSGLYRNDNSFPASRSQTIFTNYDVNRLNSAVDDFSMRIITKNGTVRVEKSSIPITVVEKAKANIKKKDDSRGGKLRY